MVTQSRTILPLQLSGACVFIRGKRIIGPIDMALEGRGITVVMGPNGAGKTTLLRLMHGMERLAAGSRAWSVSEAEARQRQAFVFQTPILMRRSVRDNLAYPLLVHGMTRQAARDRAAEWLPRIELQDAAMRSATHLSGGEKQKLALARALIREPEVLFLDEPCSNLDGRAMREIEAMLQIAHEAGTRIVMATHDLGQARRLASDVVFLYRGQLHESGPADAFFETPQTPEARAFLNGDIVE